MPSKKKTATCTKCREEKHGWFVGEVCNACRLDSRKETATCEGCGKEKHGSFTNGMCNACRLERTKKTASCEACGEEKHGRFVRGMCNACYKKSQKKTATCEVCGKEKHDTFTKGMCGACHLDSKKKTATCEACGEEKYDGFVSGMCRACYQDNQKKTATCEACGNEKHGRFTKGMCGACYAKTPQMREKKNARQRQRTRKDEGYRLARRISCGIWFGLSGKKSKPTLDLLGCTHEELLAHFEATMHEGCGNSPHVGHILVPAAWARKYAGNEGVILCFQMANLAYQNPEENIRLGDTPWYDCPFITDETIAVARKFLDIAGTDEPELAELSAFVEAYGRAAV